MTTPLFANALMDAIVYAGWISKSELARRVWGTIPDKRGYDVARNRDRIGHYLGGTSYPKPENLQKIADALGVPANELASARDYPYPMKQDAKAAVPVTLTGRFTITISP